MRASIITVSVLTLALCACSGGDEAPDTDTVTETRMDGVDVIDGTISDNMIDLDTQKDTDSVEGETSSDGQNAETDSEDIDSSDNSENSNSEENSE